MSIRVRTFVFLLPALVVGLLLLWGAGGLPPFGHYPGPYGTILNRIAVPQRHVTDVVAAVNFDYRGVDTIAEEFILFAAVAGVAVLLRTERDEVNVEPLKPESVDRAVDTSDAVRAFCLALAAPVVIVSLYVITHGHLTPGGGFQGGAILASGILLIFVAGEYATMRAISPEPRAERADAIGAGGFVVIGFAGLFAGAAFLQNIFPLGPVGALYSAGTIPSINLSIGLEVAGGFLLILSEFLRQTLQVRASGKAQQQAQEHRESPDQGQQQDQPDQHERQRDHA